jgi:hypothetical protein
MLRAHRVILVAVAMSLAFACADSKVPINAHDASFDQIESQLAHKVAQPKNSLGAVLIKSGLLEPSGKTFEGATAAASYQWKGVLGLVRQGRPADGFALHEFTKRSDVVYQTLPNGAETALLPQAGASGASALIVSGDWLIEIKLAPTKTDATVPLDDLKAFVSALEL